LADVLFFQIKPFKEYKITLFKKKLPNPILAVYLSGIIVSFQPTPNAPYFAILGDVLH